MTSLIYYVYEKVVTLAKHHQRVKVFVTYENLGGAPSFFCTNRLDWGKGKALRRYAKRWEIDAFYRDAKQILGMFSSSRAQLREMVRKGAAALLV